MLSIDDLHEPLASAFMQFSEGCFVRLGSRSPKDSDLAIATGMRVHSVSAAIRMLTDGSTRIAADLLAALNFGYSPHIFLREWLDIESWFEFRCFVVNGRVVGISQADGHLGTRYPDLIAQSLNYETIVRTFCTKLIPALHLHDVVADIVVNKRKLNDQGSVVLLEINPFSVKTHPALFSWSNDFDGSFRINQ